MDFLERINAIKGKDDFVGLVRFLLEDLRNNPEKWENRTLPEFLEALANWTEDMDGYYINNHLPIPENVNWKAFADILTAARMYE